LAADATTAIISRWVRLKDMTLRARGGYLGIQCSDDHSTQESRYTSLPDRWEIIQISSTQIRENMTDCLRNIGAALINLGGSNLNS